MVIIDSPQWMDPRDFKGKPLMSLSSVPILLYSYFLLPSLFFLLHSLLSLKSAAVVLTNQDPTSVAAWVVRTDRLVGPERQVDPDFMAQSRLLVQVAEQREVQQAVQASPLNWRPGFKVTPILVSDPKIR